MIYSLSELEAEGKVKLQKKASANHSLIVDGKPHNIDARLEQENRLVVTVLDENSDGRILFTANIPFHTTNNSELMDAVNMVVSAINNDK